MPKIDLLPCPFCGSKSVHLAENTLEGHFIGYSVHCNGCCVENRYTKHMKKAVNAWNTRASGWIACSERMPDSDGFYLAYYTFDDGRHAYDIVYFNVGCPISNAITHWMSLPEKPKGGTK